ncbi:MAG: hypothetical protein Q8R98_04305 [Rubrivivax sp.]|nr:hypothetical protein [Rubrivivax sp.]MDZ4054374.1 hypothetical protein [Phenylobacterium sp.]
MISDVLSDAARDLARYLDDDTFVSTYDDGVRQEVQCLRAQMLALAKVLDGTVRNFVCGAGIVGIKETSHGPTQRTLYP